MVSGPVVLVEKAIVADRDGEHGRVHERCERQRRLLAEAGAWRRAAGLVVAVAVMGVIGWLVPFWWPNAFTAILAVACVYLIRFAVAIGVGMHLIATTSPTRLSAAFRAWHIPRAISVTLAVMLRFFPVVASESSAVIDAMRLRGLTGARGLLRIRSSASSGSPCP